MHASAADIRLPKFSPYLCIQSPDNASLMHKFAVYSRTCIHIRACVRTCVHTYVYVRRREMADGSRKQKRKVTISLSAVIADKQREQKWTKSARRVSCYSIKLLHQLPCSARVRRTRWPESKSRRRDHANGTGSADLNPYGDRNYQELSSWPWYVARTFERRNIPIE